MTPSDTISSDPKKQKKKGGYNLLPKQKVVVPLNMKTKT
jgi:hypothetical protein